MNKIFSASLLLALAAPCAAWAAEAADVQTLRQEIEALRAAYETRLQELEQRLQATQPSAPTPDAAPPVAPPTVAATGKAASSTAFNPAISLILSGLYTRTSQDPALHTLPGFQLPQDSLSGPGDRGFSLAESELGFSANIDPWWRGAAHIALAPDDSVSVEEAYVQTTALGQGFGLKAGRFFSGVGYLNAQHAHTWDFVDNPLAYQALLGTQYADDGVRLSWLAPTDQFIELAAEVGRGRGFPGGDNSRNGAGMTALMVHAGDDIGASHSWRAGLSMLRAKATEQNVVGLNAAGDTPTSVFSGNTRVWVADAVWKWAPGGNSARTHFKLQGEYLRSTRTGTLAYDVANASSEDAYRAVHSGWYLQGIYQFIPRWRVGLRTERLHAGSLNAGVNTAALASSGHAPRKNSLMVDFNSSEFSRVRLQWAQDRARPGPADNQVFLQYQMSLGAHGAHGY
jgi:hypothetical protein